MRKRLLYIFVCVCIAFSFTACSFDFSDKNDSKETRETRKSRETTASVTKSKVSNGTLLGSWSPDIDSAEPEIVEFQYSQDKNEVERLFYTHIHAHDGIYYEYSTGTVDEYSRQAICMPVRKPEYTYFSFDLSRINEGIIYDQATDIAFYKFSDELYLDPSDLNQNSPVDFSAGWPEIEESMEEWFGYDNLIMTEGDRIWAHGCDKSFYDYINGNNDDSNVVYDPDTYRYTAQQSAQLLYSYAQQGNVKNPRVIFIISGSTYDMDSTMFVFVNGHLVYDYANDSGKQISWG